MMLLHQSESRSLKPKATNCNDTYRHSSSTFFTTLCFAVTPLSQLFSSGKTGRALLESPAGKTFGLHLVLIVELDFAFHLLGPDN